MESSIKAVQINIEESFTEKERNDFWKNIFKECKSNNFIPEKITFRFDSKSQMPQTFLDRLLGRKKEIMSVREFTNSEPACTVRTKIWAMVDEPERTNLNIGVKEEDMEKLKMMNPTPDTAHTTFLFTVVGFQNIITIPLSNVTAITFKTSE